MYLKQNNFQESFAEVHFYVAPQKLAEKAEKQIFETETIFFSTSKHEM